MIRDLGSLCDGIYDLLVVGAGIHGACVARDAALRGLRVALVDQADFGNATSHNSYKIIHGGLRYLQHMDFGRVRESINEARYWRQAAPHLVRPLQFVIPTYGYGTRGPLALWLGLQAHGMIGWDRNRDVPDGWQMPSGKVMSKSHCLDLIPGIDPQSVSGCAAWYDGQMQDSDRLLLECVMSASDAGATVANYVSVESFIGTDSRVMGVLARDALDGKEFEIRSSLTINAGGPWAASLLSRSGKPPPAAASKGLVKGMNLVTRRVIEGAHAIGVPSKRSSDAVIGDSQRLYFICPWRGRSLVGTTHFPFDGDPSNLTISDDEIAEFIDEVNLAYPQAKLDMDDVLYCYSGLTPGEGVDPDSDANRARHSDVIDHQKLEQVDGIVSIVGVKFTTARLVAEHVVDLAFRKLGRKPAACNVRSIPLPGAVGFDGFGNLKEDIDGLTAGVGSDSDNIRFLLESHRSSFPDIGNISIPEHQDARDYLFQQCCRHAVKSEMAVRLSDLLFRRTDLAARGELTEADIQWCTDLMVGELAWSDARLKEELRNTKVDCEQRFFHPKMKESTLVTA